MNDILYQNDHYTVKRTDDALGEDNKYGRPGYAVTNKETSVVEHTTMIYPQAIFQADALSGALSQLNEEGDDVGAIEATNEEIVLN